MTATTPRMPSAERREQLLSVARSLVAEQGVAGLTMEALAAAASVNKAVLYRQFDNARAVLDELFRLCSLDIAAAVVAAVEATPDRSEVARAIARAYLDAVRMNADILPALMGGNVGLPSRPDEGTPTERQDVTFAADLIVQTFDLPRDRAVAVAVVATGALAAAAEGWATGLASRRRLEDAAVAALQGALDAAR